MLVLTLNTVHIVPDNLASFVHLPGQRRIMMAWSFDVLLLYCCCCRPLGFLYNGDAAVCSRDGDHYRPPSRLYAILIESYCYCQSDSMMEVISDLSGGWKWRRCHGGPNDLPEKPPKQDNWVFLTELVSILYHWCPVFSTGVHLPNCL